MSNDSAQTTIAVVIPAYNAAGFITDALESIRAQHRLPQEIIVVDDGSFDATSGTVLSWARKYPELNVKLIRQENGGISRARNAGISAASADYIAFLDADDLYLPSHLQLLAAGAETSKETVACFGDGELFNDIGTIRKSFFAGKAVEKLSYDENRTGLRTIQGNVYCAMISGNFIPMCSLLVKRTAIEQAGAFDPKLKTSEDRDMLLRLSRLGRFAYYPKVISRIRRHSANTTSSRNTFQINKGSVEVAWKMLQSQGTLELTPEELAATNAALRNSVLSLLYFASTCGILTYARTLMDLRRRGIEIGPFGTNLKNVARATWRLFFRTSFKTN